MPTSVGPDGIAVPGYGWSNQSTQFNSNKTLESYGAASSTIINPALRQNYPAWTYDPALTSSTATTIGTTTAALIYVPQSFSCTHFDLIPVATAGNLTVAVWPSTAPAGTATPLAFSAATAASLGAVNSLTFNGTNSPAAVTLTGGQSYMVTMFSSALTTVATVTSPQAYITNAAAGTLYSITTTYRAGTVATLTTVSTASVFGVSTLGAALPWVGLR